MVDPSPERSSSPGSGRAGRSATYFSQDHEFRIDFDHSVRLTSADEKVELDTTEAFKLVAGKETLSEWITNPKLLLVASYGEDWAMAHLVELAACLVALVAHLGELAPSSIGLRPERSRHCATKSE